MKAHGCVSNKGHDGGDVRGKDCGGWAIERGMKIQHTGQALLCDMDPTK